MKTSAVRGMLLFAAGAMSATLVALAQGYSPFNPFSPGDKPMTVDEWQKQADELLLKIKDLGSRVAAIGGELAINEGPPIRCVWPPIVTNGPTVPPVPPPTDIDRHYFEVGMHSLAAANESRLAGRARLAFAIDKCWVNPDAMAAIKSRY